MRKCWDANPDKRPDMDEVVRHLEALNTSKGGGMIPEDKAHGCFCFTTRSIGILCCTFMVYDEELWNPIMPNYYVVTRQLPKSSGCKKVSCIDMVWVLE